MTAPSPPLISRYHVGILGLQPRDKATMLGVNTIELFSRRILMKIEVTSQRREMLFFLITDMAAVTSPANQQYKGSLFIISKNKSLRMLASFYLFKRTCVRQQNNVNVYLLAIKFKLHYVLALIIPQ